MSMVENNVAASEPAPTLEASAKSRVRAMLDGLPDTATLADIHHELRVLMLVLERAKALDAGAETLSQEEMGRQLESRPAIVND